MPYLIGTDEAGYGPNLGPLVISCTVWHVAANRLTDDLYPLFDGIVSRDPPTSAAPDRVPIADSKRLYKSGGTLRALELGLWAALAALGHAPQRWRDLWRLLAPEGFESMVHTAWYADFDPELPVAATRDSIVRLADSFRAAQERIGVQLLSVRSVAISPEELNRRVAQVGSKGAVLSAATVELFGQVVRSLGDEQVLVQCDKHGGRNRYGPLLQQAFSEYLVEVVREGRERSVYRWGPARRRTEVRFVVQGESFLPAALASMTSKYLRELAMLAFNTYWQHHVPGLRPTAGYPVDAQRFRRDIAAQQQRLSIPDHVLWRNK